jgi:NAD(P)-dependent dehydrogenase (short-subunit alcohol dehydrogenase family)
VLGVNLKGPFRLAALVGTRMAAGEGGSIINVSSTGAVRPRADIVPYAAAKAGLNAVTVGLAHAFGRTVRGQRHHVRHLPHRRVRRLGHGGVRTPGGDLRARPGGEPSEVVGTALYLASDWSSFTTGSVITVDGGQP